MSWARALASGVSKAAAIDAAAAANDRLTDNPIVWRRMRPSLKAPI
jgi:hypothetical protein